LPREGTFLDRDEISRFVVHQTKFLLLKAFPQFSNKTTTNSNSTFFVGMAAGGVIAAFAASGATDSHMTYGPIASVTDVQSMESRIVEIEVRNPNYYIKLKKTRP
jgi:hypothetical protein